MEVPTRLKASLAALAASAALTRPRHFSRKAFVEAAGPPTVPNGR